MSLRKKIVYLLVAFAGFALAAAFATIYGFQFRVEAAILSFEQSLDQTHSVDELRVEAREQRVRLHDVLSGALPLDSEPRASFEAFLSHLESASQFAPPHNPSSPWARVWPVAGELRGAYEHCMDRSTSDEQAYRCLERRLESGLLVDLDAALTYVKRALDEARIGSVTSLSASGTQVLVIATVIGALGAGLVAIGAALIRRWLIQPIGALQAATQQFAAGRLDYRVNLASQDELGRLGAALNEMAASLAEAQAQLRRAEAMEATVTLARGVAHDFNNLLTSATGTLSLLVSDSADPRAQERLRRALQACRRAGALARKLLDFARGTDNQPQIAGLAEIVEMILASMDEEFLKRVRVVLSLDRSVRVNMDRDQLIQVVLNLVTNARDAMPEGGELRIFVGAEPAPAGNGRLVQRFALLEVADTGHGIAAELRERVFEPFFTTRAQTTGHGRGLGLAIVYTAVTAVGGSIELESEPARGALFRVRLPLATEAPAPPPALPAPRSPALLSTKPTG